MYCYAIKLETKKIMDCSLDEVDTIILEQIHIVAHGKWLKARKILTHLLFFTQFLAYKYKFRLQTISISRTAKSIDFVLPFYFFKRTVVSEN